MLTKALVSQKGGAQYTASCRLAPRVPRPDNVRHHVGQHRSRSPFFVAHPQVAMRHSPDRFTYPGVSATQGDIDRVVVAC